MQTTLKNAFLRLTPFWIFLILFKFAAGLHYTLLAPLGAQVFPIWLVGTLIGAAAFIQLCLDVPSGYLTDRFGYRKMLGITAIFFLIAGLCFVFGVTKTTFLVSLIISILGWQFFSPGIVGYTIGQANHHNVGRMISASDVFGSIGIVLSSAAIVFAVDWHPIMIGLVLAGLFATSIIAIIIAPRDAQATVPHHKTHGRKMKLHFLRDAIRAAKHLKPASYLLMITNFTGSLFYAIIWFVIPLLIADQVNNQALGLGLGIFDFTVVILGFFLGKIVDSFNKKMLVLIGMIIFAVAGILLASNFGFLFLLLGFIATTGDELTSLSLWAWLYSENGDHEHYGLITGMTELWSDLGWSIGPVLAGILYTTVGAAWAIAVGGIIILFNLVVYVFMIKHPLPNLLRAIPEHHRKPAKHKH